MLDLDYLKTVNDTQGHSAGDDLIRLTAQTISAVLRNNDAVGRLGGDEFGVVAQYATPVGAAALMNRLKESFARAGINISMGMALRSEAGSLKKTMHLADERMYEEKRTKAAPRRVSLMSQPTRMTGYAAS
jgi:diguanylate cyclase (GGDEF)-like protein